MLQRSRLKVVLNPWSGIMPKSQKRLSKYPNISVHNMNHNSPATAETAISLLFACAKKVVKAHNDLVETKWSVRTDSKHALLLEGKQALVLGYGGIGKKVCKILKANDMNVHAIRRTVRQSKINGIYMHTADELDNLLPNSNVVIICLPGTANTRNLFTRKQLSLLPEDAILINTGRAKIINEADLYH
eukprot:UN31973